MGGQLKKFDINKYNPQDYYHWGQWKQPVLSWSFWEYWSLSDYAKSIPGKIKYEPTPFLVLDGHFLIKKTNYYQQIIDVVYQEIDSRRRPLIDYLFKVAKEFDRDAAAFLRQGNSNNLSYIKRSFALNKKAMFFWTCSLVFDQAIEKRVAEWASHLDQDEFLSAGKADIIPPSIIDRKELISWKTKLLKLKLSDSDGWNEIKKRDPNLAKKLQQYQQQTEYVGTHHYWGDPRKMPQLLEQIWESSDNKSKPSKKRKIVFSEKVKYLSNLSIRASLWRMQTVERVAQLNYAVRPALEKLATDNKLSYRQLICCTCDEIISSINNRGKIIVSTKEIAARARAYWGDLNTKTKSLLVNSGRLDKKIIDRFLDKPLENTGSNQIKGATGNKGKATGKAVIMLTPSDMKKAEEGMVLVTTMTTPDFVPAMSRASAIVTDIGGITCHAAIVSRELNKPCVIGTKSATRMIRDGDLVEVDADKGVVKVIKK